LLLSAIIVIAVTCGTIVISLFDMVFNRSLLRSPSWRCRYFFINKWNGIRPSFSM